MVATAVASQAHMYDFSMALLAAVELPCRVQRRVVFIDQHDDALPCGFDEPRREPMQECRQIGRVGFCPIGAP